MAEFVTAIRTADGDKKIDYNALANLPTEMKPSVHASSHLAGGSDPISLATQSISGLMSADDKNKLDQLDVEQLANMQLLSQHVWERRAVQTKFGEQMSLKTRALVQVAYSSSDGYGYITPYIYYADSYTYNSDTGKISLDNPQSITISLYNSDTINARLSVLQGKYWYSRTDYDVDYSVTSELFFSPSDINNFPVVSEGSYTYISIPAHIVTYGEYNEYSDWDLILSDEINAYPKCGVLDGYEYNYQGGLRERLLSLSIETGEYIGVGTCGESAPNTITFSNIVPKILFILCDGNITTLFSQLNYGRSYCTSYSGGNLNITWGSTVSWYARTYWYNTDGGGVAVGSAPTYKHQLNEPMKLYQYIGIG